MNSNLPTVARTDHNLPVLLVARELSGSGGIERDVSKYARYLRHYDIAPHVACFQPGGTRWCEIKSAGIPVVTIPFKSLKSLSVITCFRLFQRYIAEHQIQVVHAFDLSSDIFTMVFSGLLSTPVRISSHLWQRQQLPRRKQMLLSVLDRRATALFTNSEAVAQELSCRWKVKPDRICVCHNGFEPQEFHPRGRSKPPALAGASLLIGTVAVLRQEKNLKLLLKAFALGVRPRDQHARLLIVGDGPMKTELLSLAAELRITEACLFEPTTPNPADWMRALDVFVLPSSSESFSNALLEAMACGCCPVASRVGGTPELIAHGERGLLFEPDNIEDLASLLSGLVNDDLRRQKLAEQACRFAHENLTIEIAAERLARTYRRLLDSQVASVSATEARVGNPPCPSRAGTAPISTDRQQERIPVR